MYRIIKVFCFLFTYFICFSKIVNCQITRCNWLVGGNANASISNTSLNDSSYKVNSFTISPNISYFLFDNFSAGLKFSVDYSQVKYPETINGAINIVPKNIYFSGSPFLLYYFLNSEKPINVFLETSYQFQPQSLITMGINTKQSSNIFSISSGLVVYFNLSVGLDFIIGFNSIKYQNITDSFNSYSLGLDYKYI